MLIMKKLILRNVAAVLVMLGGLTGCYLPASFDAEIEVGRSGYYNIMFEGYLAEVNLYNAIESGKLSSEEEAAKVKILETDFLRDSSTKEFTYFKQGHFKVKWEKKGDILISKMVTFTRRNENMLSIAYNKSKSLVTIQGKSISKLNAKRLTDAGLGMKGQIRVKTDAKVIKHNAGTVKKGTGRNKIYIWDIKNPYDKMPVLTFNLR